MTRTLNKKEFYTPQAPISYESYKSTFVKLYVERFNLKIDPEWSERQSRLHILEKFYDGTIYDNLAPFYREYNGSGGTYIKLAERRPSVIFPLPKIIVDDSVSMLFGESHFPTIHCDNENTINFLNYITKKSNLQEAMLNAAKEGCIGSVAIIVKILNGNFYFDVLNTKHLIPVFDQYNPCELISLRDRRKYDGYSLLMMGYEIPKDKRREIYYIERLWTIDEEIYFEPYTVVQYQDESFQLTIDTERSIKHDLGFVPAVWIKNLPCANSVDGACTFQPLIDISIEINYQMSQLGRLLKYNSDPTIVIKNPSNLEGQEVIKGIGTLTLDEKGDAYMLEMSNGATKSVLDYVNKLRELALESVRGNRANPERISAAHSGKALQFLNMPLISLVEEMKLTYGNFGLLRIYRMIMDMVNNKSFEVSIDADIKEMDYSDRDKIFLDWPDWYPVTPQDRLQTAQSLQFLTGSNNLSHETAIKSISKDYNIENINNELKTIENELSMTYNKNSGVDRPTETVDRVEDK